MKIHFLEFLGEQITLNNDQKTHSYNQMFMNCIRFFFRIVFQLFINDFILREIYRVLRSPVYEVKYLMNEKSIIQSMFKSF